MTELKVGDRVKIVGPTFIGWTSRLGELVTITRDWGDGDYSVNASELHSGRIFNKRSLQKMARTLEEAVVGDVLVDENAYSSDHYTKKVLAVVKNRDDETYLVTEDSDDGDINVVPVSDEDWKIKGEDAEELTEVTLEDIAKKFNVSVDKIRVKE